MRMTRIILALTMAIAIWSPKTTEAGAGGTPLLRDDYVFAGVDGKLVQSGPDKWSFELESGISEGKAEIGAGQSLEMLRSATLEKMIADAKERTDARYRLWGKATKFEGKNYIFPVYFVGLKKLAAPAENKPQQKATADKSAGRPQQGSKGKKTVPVNAPNDVLNIPDEIVAQLGTSEVLPTEEIQATQEAALELKQDTIFANRTGFVVAKDGKYLFEPDGLGRGIEKISLELLPCQKLEEAVMQMRGEPNPVRFSVAGVLTRYKDKQYLLLQKATRAYSYGNFGK